METPFLITHIGPWTFVYGGLFSILAILLARVSKPVVGLVFLLGLLLYLRDVSGTVLAFSVFTLYLLSPVKLAFPKEVKE